MNFVTGGRRFSPKGGRIALCWQLAAVMGLGGGELAGTARADEPEVVAVYSRVSPSYHRVKDPNGGFQPETYMFGKGGFGSGGMDDPTIDRLDFMDVAKQVAPALAQQRYVPSKDPATTQLLVMVYWGSTVRTDNSSHSAEYQAASSLLPQPVMPLSPPPTGINGDGMAADPSMGGRATEVAMNTAMQLAADSAFQQSAMLTEMANRRRDHQDQTNAEVLGYVDELRRVRADAQTPFKFRWQDVLDEVEEGRYYVVLLAYDFQLLWKHHQRRILWQTRFSIRERGNAFDEQLASMTRAASRYFGQDTGGLLRQRFRDPNITMGPLRVVNDGAAAGEHESSTAARPGEKR